MHPFVKILIVVNLLFAVGFWAYTASALNTTTNYKTQLEQAQRQSLETQERLESEMRSLRAELQGARDGRSSADQRAEQEKARADNLETQLAEAKRRNTTLSDDITKITAQLTDINATIAQINAEKDRAFEQVRAAERARDQAIAAQRTAEFGQRDATDGLTSAQTTIGDLEGQIAQLRSDLSRAQAQIETATAMYNIRWNEISAQPAIDGAVTAVDSSTGTGLVMLNVGSGAGVRRGMTFEVYSGNQYKGQVRVENVMDENNASALVVRSGVAPIARGDRITTRL